MGKLMELVRAVLVLFSFAAFLLVGYGLLQGPPSHYTPFDLLVFSLGLFVLFLFALNIFYLIRCPPPGSPKETGT